MKRKNKTRGVAVSAIIAACYVVLTLISALFGLSGSGIQVRLSEALTVLPVFTPYAIPGLFIGCIISNIITGCAIWDIIFGSITTLLAAILTYILKKHNILSLLPQIIFNSIVIPVILVYVYSTNGALWYFMLTVFIGQFISCGVLGYLLRKSLNKRNIFNKL